MIRKACLGDASRLAEIIIFAKRTAYRPIFRNDKVSFGEMQVLPLALRYIDNPGLLDGIIVYDDDFAKGMANARQELLGGRTATHLTELFVDPFFQNHGIGGKLLSEAEEYSSCAGVNIIFLWVLEKNTDAIRFYEKHGNIQTAERMLLDSTPEYIIMYVKEL